MTKTHNHNNTNQSLNDLIDASIRMYARMDCDMVRQLFATVASARSDALTGRDEWATHIETLTLTRDRIERTMLDDEVTMLGITQVTNLHFVMSVMDDARCRTVPDTWDIVETELIDRFVAYGVSQAIVDEWPVDLETARHFAATSFVFVYGMSLPIAA